MSTPRATIASGGGRGRSVRAAGEQRRVDVGRVERGERVEVESGRVVAERRVAEQPCIGDWRGAVKPGNPKGIEGFDVVTSPKADPETLDFVAYLKSDEAQELFEARGMFR